jgi:hypothetical protein
MNMTDNLSTSTEDKPARFFIPGECAILTDIGYFFPTEVVGHLIKVWNGSSWTTANVVTVDEKRHILTLVLSNGRTVNCTHDTLLPLSDTESVMVHNMELGSILNQKNLPIIDGIQEFPSPYLHGNVAAFGVVDRGNVHVDWPLSALERLVERATIDGPMDRMPHPHSVPINAPLKTKIDWLHGFMDGRSYKSKLGVILMNDKEALLYTIAMMLTTLNTVSYLNRSVSRMVHISREAGVQGQNYTLLIPWLELRKLIQLGLKSPHEPPTFFLPMCSEITVVEIIDIGRYESGYALEFEAGSGTACTINGITLSL